MTNRNNQLVLNIRCAAKQAAKHGNVVVEAGRDMGMLLPTAFPSVGRLPMSSGSPGYRPSFTSSPRTTETRTTTTLRSTPGMRSITGCWREAMKPEGRKRRVSCLSLTAHDLTGHHDYPSHDDRHDNRFAPISTTFANIGK